MTTKGVTREQKMEWILEALKYAHSFVEAGCPRFDQIHTRLKLEEAIALAEETEAKNDKKEG